MSSQISSPIKRPAGWREFLVVGIATVWVNRRGERFMNEGKSYYGIGKLFATWDQVKYGYRNLRVPVVEPTPLFVRGIGEVTDIVEHEMYTFEDKLNGESLTLRPEATAGIVRAAIQHNLIYERPQRVWTAGPMFRHERPQKGRYRQFHQFDIEAL